MSKALFLIPCACFLLYINAFSGGFHYDDIHSIVDNRYIRSFSNVLGFFLNPDFFSHDPAKSMYRPVLLVSYALNYHFSGYQSWSYHLVNIILHAACALCVFVLAKKIIGNMFAGWVASISFMCHPIATETVNYISSRSESLSALFYVLCMIFSLRETRGNLFAQYASYVVGLLCKSVIITAPITIYFLNCFKKKKKNKFYYLSFLFLAFCYISLIYGNRFLLDSLSDPVRTPVVQLLTQLKAPAYYVYLAFVPVKLSIHHPFVESHIYTDWAVVSSVFFVVSIVFVAWIGRGTVGGWAITWMGVSLMPTFIMPLNMMINERRLYLPLIALSLSLSWILSRYKCLKVFGIATIIVWSGLTLQRTSTWGSDIALWKAAEKMAPNEHNVQNNLGKSLQSHGRFTEAMVAYKRAMLLGPTKGEAANNIATLHHQAGETMLTSATPESAWVRLNTAKHWYYIAKEATPKSTAILTNLASAHLLLGEIDSSYQYFEECLEINTHNAAVWNNYGQALYDGGKLFLAQKAFRRAIGLDTTLVEPRNNLANIARDFGKITEAEKYYRAALARATGKNRESIIFNLASLMLKLERFVEARDIVLDEISHSGPREKLYLLQAKIEIVSGDFEAAELACNEGLLVYPDSPDIYIKRAEIRFGIAQINKAISDFLYALSLDEKSARAFYGLGNAYKRLGNNKEAVVAFREFLKLWPSYKPKSISTRKWLSNIGALN